MLRIRPYGGLGEAQPKIYLETGDCGVVQGGSWPFSSDSGRPCKRWSFDELFSGLPKGGTVSVAQQNVQFYGSPRDLVDKLGVCRTIELAFRQGFTVPGPNGIEQVEPGVFHPSKSWQEMFDESNALRSGNFKRWTNCRGDGAQSVDDFKAGIQTMSVPYAIVIRNADGSTMCEATGGEGVVSSWSVTMPEQYRNSEIVIRTAMQWIDDYSKSRVSYTLGTGNKVEPGHDWWYCFEQSAPVYTVDPDLGHSYDAVQMSTVRIGPGGVDEGPVGRTLEGPILAVYVDPNVGPATSIATSWATIWTAGLTKNTLAAITVGAGVSALVQSVSEGQWINLTPSQVKRAMSSGQWPLPGVTRARWRDTGQEFDPRALTTRPPGAQQASSGGAIIGVVGLAAGILLFIFARKQK